MGVMAGLCATCIHAKEMRNDRGSVFLFCLLSRTDARFAKYPRLPVLSCAGYRELRVGAGETQDQAAESEGRGQQRPGRE